MAEMIRFFLLTNKPIKQNTYKISTEERVQLNKGFSKTSANKGLAIKQQHRNRTDL